MAAGAFASTSYCTVPTAAREGFSTKRQTQQQRHSHEAAASNQSLRSSFKGEKVTTSGMLATNDLSALKARKAVANNNSKRLMEISAVLAEFPKETVVSLNPNFRNSHRNMHGHALLARPCPELGMLVEDANCIDLALLSTPTLGDRDFLGIVLLGLDLVALTG